MSNRLNGEKTNAKAQSIPKKEQKPKDRASRDANGKFAMGNPGGPGRPSRAIERDYVEAFRGACPPAVFGKIIESLVKKSLLGNQAAIDLITRYILGADRLDLGKLAAKEEANQASEDDTARTAISLRIEKRVEKLENTKVIAMLLQHEK